MKRTIPLSERSIDWFFISAFISDFIWGPLYIVFILGITRGWDWIRNYGLIYGGALTHGMTTYPAEGLFVVHASPKIRKTYQEYAGRISAGKIP